MEKIEKGREICAFEVANRSGKCKSVSTRLEQVVHANCWLPEVDSPLARAEYAAECWAK
jgi:hypothetical protein